MLWVTLSKGFCVACRTPSYPTAAARLSQNSEIQGDYRAAVAASDRQPRPPALLRRKLLAEGSQRRNGHDQEYPRSGMDPGDGGGLTGHDAQPYAAHISP